MHGEAGCTFQVCKRCRRDLGGAEYGTVASPCCDDCPVPTRETGRSYLADLDLEQEDDLEEPELEGQDDGESVRGEPVPEASVKPIQWDDGESDEERFCGSRICKLGREEPQVMAERFPKRHQGRRAGQRAQE